MWYLTGERWVFFKLGECLALLFSTLKGSFRSATSFQVHGFESSSYQGYDSVVEAEAAWEHACACGVIGNPSSPMKKTSTSPASIQKISVPHPLTSSLDSLSTAVQEPLPERSAFTPVPRKLLPPTPVSPPAHYFQAMPTRPLGDEQVWWVVITGEFPGAYLGR